MLVSVGSKFSASVMVRRAVEKELQVAALLREDRSIIKPEDWSKISALRDEAMIEKLIVSGTSWKDVFKQPIKLLVRARQYHAAVEECLSEARIAYARAVLDPAFVEANQHTCQWGDPQLDQTLTSQSEEGAGIDIPDVPLDDGSPSYDSTMTIDDPFTTYFENIIVLAGAEAQVTLHFGVADVPVTIKPDKHLVGVPASYVGPLALSGYVTLVPCDSCDELNQGPGIVIGRYSQGYNLEFSGMSWCVPPDHLVRVGGVDEEASLEVAYGEDWEAMPMPDEGDEGLEMLQGRAGQLSR